MRIRALELDEFRSFRSLHFDIDAAGFRAAGPNASGKSTLLEAIAMLSTTRSPRTSTEREIPHWSSGADMGLPPYARARVEFERADGPHQLEIGITSSDQGSGPLRKQIKLDGRPVRALDAVGQLKSVLFSPEDVDLIAGPPGMRRRYLDITLSQAHQGYLRALTQYGRIIEQRNSLLRSLVRERVSADSPRAAQELAFWDAELVAAGTQVLAFRIGGIAALSARARAHFEKLTGVPTLALSYDSRRLSPFGQFEVNSAWTSPPNALRQKVAAAFTHALGEVRAEELRRGTTAIGPHRDDFTVTSEGIDLGRFGSRGQQRLAVIAVKLAEVDLLEVAAGESPLLLLDDVLSELDPVHRARLLATISSSQAQVCMTAADMNDLNEPALLGLPLLRVEAGTILAESG